MNHATAASGQPEQVVYTMLEIAALLRVTKPTVYKSIANGELRTFTLGRRRLATREAVDELIRKRETHQ